MPSPQTPSQPSTEEPSLASGLADLADDLEPLFEQADGLKKRMEDRGWSPMAAEQIALTWLTGALRAFWAQAAAAATR